jgi:hypothetical protein
MWDEKENPNSAILPLINIFFCFQLKPNISNVLIFQYVAHSELINNQNLVCNFLPSRTSTLFSLILINIIDIYIFSAGNCSYHTNEVSVVSLITLQSNLILLIM